MNKEDFILGDLDYESEFEGIIVHISKYAMNDSSIAYAHKILMLYKSNKSKVIDYILNEGVLDFYKSRYSTNEIIEKLNDAEITIISSNWGTLTWINHNLDEHIIEVEFVNDLQLTYVSIDG